MKMIQPGQPAIVKPRIAFEPLTDGYGFFTRSRLRSAVNRFAGQHIQGELKVIQLEPGARLLLSNHPDLCVSYLGMSGGKCVFSTGYGDRIEKALLKASGGIRYDILVGQYWTRELAAGVFGKVAGIERVSQIQAIELVVLDKKLGGMRASWLSLGLEKEALISLGDGSGTFRLPEIRPFEENRLVPPPAGNAVSVNAPNTMLILTPVEAMRLTRQAVERKRFTIIGEGQPILGYSKAMSIRGRPVEFGKMGDTIRLRFVRDGHRVTEEFGIEKARGMVGIELASGYRAVLHGYPLEDNAKSLEADYAMVAAVFSPLNQLYSAYIFGARG